MIGGHVRDDRDVVVHHADPSQEDAASSGLQHGDVGMLIEGDRRLPRSPSSPPSGRADRSRYTPSVEENATRLPAVITMWARSRVVVVFPFVPLTWITGTSGPARWARVRARRPPPRERAPRSPARASAGGRAPSRSRPHSASASADPRRRHGKTTITCPNSGPVRPRTPSHPVPAAAAIRLVSWTATRAVARTRCSLPRAPGSSRADPRRVRDRGHLLVADAEPPGDVERELDGGSREIEVRAFEHPQLDGPDRLRPRVYRAVGTGGRVDLRGSATSFSVTPPASCVESDDRDAVVVDLDVRMVTGCIGVLGHSVHERDRRAEAGEREVA